MKLLFVMDGTVPIVAAKVIATDGWDEVQEDQYAGQVEVRDVDDNVGGIPATWVVVNINENGGIDGVWPATGELDAQSISEDYGDNDEDRISGPHYVDPRHFAYTIDGESGDEGYSHGFKL